MRRLTRRARLLAMAWLGTGMAAVTLLLRAWLMPTLRDAETGLFSSGQPVVVLMLVTLALLAIIGFTLPKERREITHPAGPRVGIVTIISGGVLALCGLWDGLVWLGEGRMPAPVTASATGIAVAVLLLQLVCAMAGGVALVRLGLLMVAEGGTRRGIAGWSMLAPVLWIWFRLARYEMSYVSTVRLSESFFDFVMFIFELLFLFKLARYTAGVGRVGMGDLQFYAAATALFALSGPLTRLAMYLLGDSEAYLASELAGVSDVAVGLLAAAVAFGLTTEPAEEITPMIPSPTEDQPEGASSGSSASEDEPDPFDFIIGE